MTLHSQSVVGIDQGTTATKAYRLSADGDFRHLCSIEHRQIYPQPGWVEHDPRELLASVERCLDSAGGVAGAGVDNQGETVIAWDADSGEPVHNAIVWHDNRTRDVTDRLKAEGAEKITLERAGLPLDPYFSASKLRWILDHVPGAAALAQRGKLRLGTSDAFFLERLCGRYATDVVTASRTSLMNLETGEWDSELCRLFGVPMHLLPPIQASVGEFGIARRVNVPIVAGIVDQQAALFGHGCRMAGQAKITFGTGAFALAVTGRQPVSAPDSGLLPTVAWRLGAQTIYAVDGGVYNAGSALDWARRLGLFSQFTEIEEFEVPSAIERGIVFVPALSGLACPYWDRTAAGLWLGMGLDTSSRDLVQAVLEGAAQRAGDGGDARAAAAGIQRLHRRWAFAQPLFLPVPRQCPEPNRGHPCNNRPHGSGRLAARVSRLGLEQRRVGPAGGCTRAHHRTARASPGRGPRPVRRRRGSRTWMANRLKYPCAFDGTDH